MNRPQSELLKILAALGVVLFFGAFLSISTCRSRAQCKARGGVETGMFFQRSSCIKIGSVIDDN